MTSERNKRVLREWFEARPSKPPEELLPTYMAIAICIIVVAFIILSGVMGW